VGCNTGAILNEFAAKGNECTDGSECDKALFFKWFFYMFISENWTFVKNNMGVINSIPLEYEH